jgi:hypothetical protein
MLPGAASDDEASPLGVGLGPVSSSAPWVMVTGAKPKRSPLVQL